MHLTNEEACCAPGRTGLYYLCTYGISRLVVLKTQELLKLAELICVLSQELVSAGRAAEKKFLQLLVGVSTTACLDHFHHQIPASFSLLQLSWLQP